jgi:hypothetical protein
MGAARSAFNLPLLAALGICVGGAALFFEFVVHGHVCAGWISNVTKPIGACAIAAQQKAEIEWIETLLERKNPHRAGCEYEPFSRERMGFDDDD